MFSTDEPSGAPDVEGLSGAAEGWRLVALVGLAALVVVTLAAQLVAVSLMPRAAAFGVVFGGLLAVCLGPGRYHRWPYVIGGAEAALFVLGDMPPMVDNLAHPETPFTFVPEALGLAAASLVGAAAIALMARSTLPAGVAVAGAGAVSIAALGLSTRAVIGLERHEPRPGDVLVAIESGRYPEDVTVRGGNVALYLDNRDRVRHTFVIEALGVHVELPGLVGRRVELTLPAGTYRFRCDVPGHESMEGLLVARGAGGAARPDAARPVGMSSWAARAAVQTVVQHPPLPRRGIRGMEAQP